MLTSKLKKMIWTECFTFLERSQKYEQKLKALRVGSETGKVKVHYIISHLTLTKQLLPKPKHICVRVYGLCVPTIGRKTLLTTPVQFLMYSETLSVSLVQTKSVPSHSLIGKTI